MKFNNEEKKYFRKIIEKSTNKVSENKRLVINPCILNELLFEKENINGITLKRIVWSGDFLKKIDLSEINFENVIWNNIDYVNLNNCNVNIDFSNSFEAIFNNSLYNEMFLDLRNVNLENVDLSNSNSNIIYNIDNCNLKNTNILLNFPFMNINDSDLSLNNFNCNITLGDSYIGNTYIYNSNFSDTNVNFIVDKNYENELKLLKNNGFLNNVSYNIKKINISRIKK